MSVVYLHADGLRPFFFPFYKFTASPFIHIKYFTLTTKKIRATIKITSDECCVDLNLNCTVNISGAEKRRSGAAAAGSRKGCPLIRVDGQRDTRSLIAYPTKRMQRARPVEMHGETSAHVVWVYCWLHNPNNNNLA
jgi:hypothetical protein